MNNLKTNDFFKKMKMRTSRLVAALRPPSLEAAASCNFVGGAVRGCTWCVERERVYGACSVVGR
eukprot:scaffold13717_cov132-Isochrysis_galbana.AAC.1